MILARGRERALVKRRALERTVQRVERLVDSETASLRSRTPIDLREFNNGKSQALLELNIAARSLDPAVLDDEMIKRLKVLRGKLEANREVLHMHLEAVREIAAVVAQTIQASEWDGTYSQQLEPVGQPR